MTPIQIAIFAAVALGAIAALISTIRRAKKNKTSSNDLGSELLPEWEGGPYRREYNIAGINKYGLTGKDCGLARGWVMRDKENKYDKNAVAIFRGETHVGYLNRDIAKEIAPKLDEIDKAVPCLLSIWREFDGTDRRPYFVGRVKILWPDTE